MRLRNRWSGGVGAKAVIAAQQIKLTFAVYDTVDVVFAWESLSVQILKREMIERAH